MNETLLQRGIKGENAVIKALESEFGDKITILHKKTWGCDITAYINSNYNRELKIEVKSCKHYISDRKNGKKIIRLGRFYILPEQIPNTDFFAFVILGSNNQIFFVKKENLELFLKNRKQNAKRHPISIKQLRYLQPKTRLGDLL
ncbi:MAG TPA: hypothetical protein ENI51_07880 [Candidatus Atribacteria bacterium]|nr:hypothetical protein [Candidatus Atribacteria bacterium]